MNRDRPTQAFAARDAHEALLVLRELVDDAAETVHAAELESFHVAVSEGQNTDVRRTLTERRETPKVSRLRCPAVSGAGKTGNRGFQLGGTRGTGSA
jgi:hypothetical protein